MSLRTILKGAVTFVPGVLSFARKVRGNTTGGTDSARYCYSVWLRHLVYAYQSGMQNIPKVVAELGPGDSIGTGLAALLSGADKYIGLDVVPFANVAKNAVIFDELVTLFQARTPIPGQQELPAVSPSLPSYEFPYHILTEELLSESLAPQRIDAIRASLLGMSNNSLDGMVCYFAPWDRSDIAMRESVDFLFSQSMLEYCDDMEGLFHQMRLWLKQGGIMSHEIDLTSMAIDPVWNNHWQYGDLAWKLVKGNRPVFINRQPFSTYQKLAGEPHFTLKCTVIKHDNNGLARGMSCRSRTWQRMR